MIDLGYYTAMDCADYLLEKYSKCDDSQSVSCICCYEQMNKILTALLLLGEGEIDVVSCDMHFETEGEFILTIDDLGVWIQPLTTEQKNIEEKYLTYHSEYILIEENCNSLTLKFNECKEADVSSFSFDNYEFSKTIRRSEFPNESLSGTISSCKIPYSYINNCKFKNISSISPSLLKDEYIRNSTISVCKIPLAKKFPNSIFS